MSDRFDYFIVLAEMRTGSNFLESNLNAVDGLSCLGEAFNPHFVGYPNKTSLLGIDQIDREADPMRLVNAIRNRPGLAGFRFFHDHDARIGEAALADPRCAKIVLTRNPLESYVSLKIAQATGQWKLTDVARRKSALAAFDAAEFSAHLENTQAFQMHVLRGLQTSGQTAFYLAYEDLSSLEVMNGLFNWLGIEARLQQLDQSLKPQNPTGLDEKLANPEQVEQALAGHDRFNFSRTPNFEPRRGPAVASYVAAARAPLLFLPVKCGPEAEILSWLAALDGEAPDALRRALSQKDLRQWKRRNPGHRSFTVLRHPVERAHAAFCQKILPTGPGSYRQIRNTLQRVFKAPLPADMPDPDYDRATHKTAFRSFLSFLSANLAGQTALRVDGAWSSQSQIVQGFGEFAPPDFVWREAEWREAARDLAKSLGLPDIAAPVSMPDEPFELADIYDDEIEMMAKKVYQRDYMMFGFGPWSS